MPVGVGVGSSIISRMMLAFRAGLQFHGKRNLYEVFGYPRRITETMLYGKYQRQDIVSRIVNMPPEEMWSLKPTLKPFAGVDTKWDELCKVAQIWDRIIQADKLCCFGPFSTLLLGMPGNADQPAPPLTNLKNLLYVQAYGGDSARINSYEVDPSNPRFGQPLMYEIRTGPDHNSLFIKVHHSRIIHIVDRPLQGQIISEPRLGQVYNLLEDLSKIAGGSAELFWIIGNRGMQVDVDKEMDMNADDANALTAELDEFQHGLRRYVRTRGVKINSLGSDSADPTGVFDVLMSLLAATTSIPQRILMGSEVGQLASEQDRANWSEYIERRRTTFGGPYVLTPIFRKLGELGYFPPDAWQNAEWTWPEAFHMNPVEKSNARASNARAIANLSRRNQFGNPVVSDEEVRIWFDLPEKVAAGATMPEMPAPTTGGPQSAPSGGAGKKKVASVTDAPSAIANREAFVEGEVIQGVDRIEIPLSIRLGDIHVHNPEQPPAEVTVNNNVSPANVTVPVTNHVAPAAVTVETPEVRVVNNVAPAEVRIPVNVAAPEIKLGDIHVEAPEVEVKMGEINVNATLTPAAGKKASATKYITASRNPVTGTLEGLVSDKPIIPNT